MNNTINGIILILMGCGCVVLAKHATGKMVKFWSKIRYTRGSEKGYRILVILIGIGWIVLGILALLQLI